MVRALPCAAHVARTIGRVPAAVNRPKDVARANPCAKKGQPLERARRPLQVRQAFDDGCNGEAGFDFGQWRTETEVGAKTKTKTKTKTNITHQAVSRWRSGSSIASTSRLAPDRISNTRCLASMC